MVKKSVKADTCFLCLDEPVDNFHHFIPKPYRTEEENHYTGGICYDCHELINGNLTNEQQAFEYNSETKLRRWYRERV